MRWRVKLWYKPKPIENGVNSVFCSRKKYTWPLHLMTNIEEVSAHTVWKKVSNAAVISSLNYSLNSRQARHFGHFKPHGCFCDND